MDLPITILDLDTNLYECYICTLLFNDISDLKHHTSSEHPEILRYKHVCNKCGKVFPKNYNLQRHSSNCKVKKYKCNKCSSNFKYEKNLLRHYKNKHA